MIVDIDDDIEMRWYWCWWWYWDEMIVDVDDDIEMGWHWCSWCHWDEMLLMLMMSSWWMYVAYVHGVQWPIGYPWRGKGIGLKISGVVFTLEEGISTSHVCLKGQRPIFLELWKLCYLNFYFFLFFEVDKRGAFAPTYPPMRNSDLRSSG